MTDGPPDFGRLARRLLEREARGSQDPAALLEAGGRVWEKLYGQLAPLIGFHGFRAMAMRALREAQQEFPFLEGTTVPAERYAPAIGSQEQIQGRDPRQALEALVATLGDFLELLFELLGRALPRRLLRAAWPGIESENGSPLPGK